MASAFSHSRSIAAQTTILTNAVQSFDSNIWKAAVGKSLKRSMHVSSFLRSSSRFNESPESFQNKSSDQNSKDEKVAAILRKNAREDLFKHFRMSAGMRAMKRGDGVLSEYFSLGKDAHTNSRNDYMPHFYQEGAVQPEFQSLFGMAPKQKAREKFRRNFSKTHQERNAIVTNANGAFGSLFQCERMNDSVEEDMAAEVTRRNAREDVFKHFRVSAGLRAMKRGDGVLSEYFSLNTINFSPPKQYARHSNKDDHHHEFSSFVHAASKRSAREQFRQHFWKAHEERKAIINARYEEKSRSAIKPITIPQTTFQAQNSSTKQRIPLPTSLNDAYKEIIGNRTVHQPRAMAITEIQPPFKIIDVNKAWVDLCGYSREQAVGATIKTLLHGPETNLEVAQSLVSRLVDVDTFDESEAVVVNYRSDCKKFRNHVRVGALRDEKSGNVTHLVGVFCKLRDDLNDEFYANV